MLGCGHGDHSTRAGQPCWPRVRTASVPNQTGAGIDPHWVEYDAQDMVRGDMCVVKELASGAVCSREWSGLPIVPLAGEEARWLRAVEEFLSNEVAHEIGAHPVTISVRRRWASTGTGYYALELVPGNRTAPYRSNALGGPVSEYGGSLPASLASEARSPLGPGSVVGSVYPEPLVLPGEAAVPRGGLKLVATQAEMAARVASVQ